MFDILAILIPFFLAACIVVVIRIVVEARLRRRLAETHATEDLVRSLVAADDEFRRQSSLRWGLVLVAMGAGFGAVDLFSLGVEDPAAFGLLFAAAGIGSLAYHFLRRPPTG
ncbi:hypothetical protein H0E84_16665 [Luteimonas sp. SJ-92]|uniref:DUF6249 domain-containing protein n=1 Tax=Luteimonas salinisoli TaxID=2752307 RepID=A0A853JH15_9GAMM|nr:DUF6249 domain-containing protein [Luteimonas salinisoli]NZA28012.1 hypothetical protein [Luteimonas salinisoli]